MPHYTYKVIDWQGRRREGTYRAGNMQEVADYLRARKYTILRIKERAGQAFLPDTLINQNRAKKIKSRDYMIFCRHFSSMISAGFTILKSLQILGVQTENANMREKIREVSLSVEKGYTLAQSMDEYPDSFPAIMTNMIAAGEAGGMLAEVLERLAVHFERQSDFEEKMRSALIYPVVISVVAFLVMGIMVFFVLPTFSTMFTNMGAELPLLTQAVLGLAGFAANHWLIILVALLIISAVLKLYVRTEQFRWFRDRMLLKFPGLSTLYTKMAAARFARGLSSLLKSGVDILVALELADKVIDNRVFNSIITKVRLDISDGHTMASSLKKSGFFPDMMVEMIRVGEETGYLDDMLNHAANLYEREVTYSVDRISSITEPAVLIFVGVFVGVLVISLILPMFQIYGGL